MFLTVHAAAGALVGAALGNAPAAFALGMASHFLLDRIPHADPPIAEGTGPEGVFRHPMMRRFVLISAVDLVLAGVLTAWLGYLLPAANVPALAAGAFGGVLPDLLFGLYRLTGNRWLGRFDRLHQANHFDPKKIRVTFAAGMATQIATLAVCLNFLLRYW